VLILVLLNQRLLFNQTKSRKLESFGILENQALIDTFDYVVADVLVIEQIKSYGMPMDDNILDTIFWSGRMAQAWSFRCERIGRKTIAAELCGSAKASDSNVRQALINLFGGKTEAIGSKINPGPLYGVAKDVWSALAVAVAWDQREQRSLDLLK